MMLRLFRFWTQVVGILWTSFPLVPTDSRFTTAHLHPPIQDWSLLAPKTQDGDSRNVNLRRQNVSPLTNWWDYTWNGLISGSEMFMTCLIYILCLQNHRSDITKYTMSGLLPANIRLQPNRETPLPNYGGNATSHPNKHFPNVLMQHQHLHQSMTKEPASVFSYWWMSMWPRGLHSHVSSSVISIAHTHTHTHFLRPWHILHFSPLTFILSGKNKPEEEVTSVV